VLKSVELRGLDVYKIIYIRAAHLARLLEVVDFRIVRLPCRTIAHLHLGQLIGLAETVVVQLNDRLARATSPLPPRLWGSDPLILGVDICFLCV
jgi:hypothetical protein